MLFSCSVEYRAAVSEYLFGQFLTGNSVKRNRVPPLLILRNLLGYAARLGAFVGACSAAGALTVTEFCLRTRMACSHNFFSLEDIAVLFVALHPPQSLPRDGR